MTTRVVNVRLVLSANDFNDGMIRSGASVRVLIGDLDDVGAQARNSQAAMQDIAKYGMIAGGALTVAFGAAVKIFADFDQQMSNVGAASFATTQELASLRQAAIDAGRETFFSATEAAKGEEELAKAGLKAADITGGALTGALNLAAAGGIEVADAAETAANAMTVFGLSGKDVPHIADVLAAAAGKAQGSVDDMSQAFKQAALVSNQTGLSLEDTAGVLAEFASAGLKGSDAGTSLRTMLLRLNPQSKEAATLIDQLGISAFDSQGQFIGMATYADKLQGAMAGMSTETRNAALQTIFGQDAIRAATVLYTGGAEGVKEWTDAVNDQGYASDQAAKRMDNLNGDIEQLEGSIESAILGAGSGANDVLRTMTQHATNVVQGFSALPRELQEVAVGFAGIGGTAATAGIGMALAYSKLGELQTGLAGGGTMAQAMGRGVGVMKNSLLVAIPVFAAATIALDYYGKKKAEAKAAVDSFRRAIEADNGAIDENTRKLIAKKIVDDGLIDSAEKLGISAQDVTDAIAGQSDALARVKVAAEKADDANKTSQKTALKQKTQMDTSQENWEKLTGATTSNTYELQSNASAGKDLVNNIQNQNKALTQAQQAYLDVENAAGKTSFTQQQNKTVVDSVAKAMNDEASAADSLKKALDGLNSTSLDVDAAQVAFLDAIQNVKNGLADNGKALDMNTEKSRDNRSAIESAIQKAQDYAIATSQQSGSVEAGISVYEDNINTLFDQLAAMGLNADQLADLRQKVIDIPALKQILLQADTKAAADNLGLIQSQLNDITRLMGNLNGAQVTAYVKIRTQLEDATAGSAAAARLGEQMSMIGQSDGGRVIGPGSGTSDSVPRLLSNGEYVLQESTARAIGYSNLDALNTGRPMVPVTSVSSGARPMGGMTATDLDRVADRIIAGLANRPVSVQLDKRELVKTVNEENARRF